MDLLVVVFMTLIALTVLSIVLLFLLKNGIAKRVFFYLALALGLFASWGAISIGLIGSFIIQLVLGIATAVICVGLGVLSVIKRKDERVFFFAKTLAAVTLVVALFNAIL